MQYINKLDRFKFRAFDNEQKKYVNDDDICFDTNGQCDSVYELMEVCLGNTNKYVFEQCTGLRDKSGKLIFENDIVRVDGWNYCVSFDETHPGFLLENPEEFFEEISIENADECEIIGNFHESSDLIDKNN